MNVEELHTEVSGRNLAERSERRLKWDNRG